MLHRFVVVLAFGLFGCQFDSSVSLGLLDADLVEVDAERANGDAGDGCDAHQPAPCGQCGTETCTDTPSGPQFQCVADDAVCGADTNCLPSDLGTQNCLVACSTEGYRTPFDTGYGLSDAIPDVVDLGDYWLSTDGCAYSDAYRVCVCEYPNNNGPPQVYCDDCDFY